MTFLQNYAIFLLKSKRDNSDKSRFRIDKELIRRGKQGMAMCIKLKVYDLWYDALIIDTKFPIRGGYDEEDALNMLIVDDRIYTGWVVKYSAGGAITDNIELVFLYRDKENVVQSLTYYVDYCLPFINKESVIPCGKYDDAYDMVTKNYYWDKG